MSQIRVHGLDAYYRHEGSGTAMLLGHSSTGSSGQWRELFKRMSGRYRLVALDHIGYGRTAMYRRSLLDSARVALLNRREGPEADIHVLSDLRL